MSETVRQRFTGQVVWVTGASSGIGLELARQFAEEGADVCVSARRGERLQQLASEIEARGGRALAMACDVTDEEGMSAVVRTIVERFGRLDVAVANAGFAVSGPIEKVTLAEWRRQLEVNVLGLTTTIRLALPHLRKTRGRVVLLASVAGMLPMPGTGPYGASKAAVISIGRTLSVELHGSGVTCTTICPGFVESEIYGVDNEGVYRAERARKNPIAWPVDRAVAVMIRAILRRRRLYVFTAHGRVAGFVARHFPDLLHFVLTRRSARRLARR